MRYLIVMFLVFISVSFNAIADAKLLICTNSDNISEMNRLKKMADDPSFRGVANKFKAQSKNCEFSKFSFKNEFLFNTEKLGSPESFAEFTRYLACGSIVHDTVRVKIIKSPSVLSFKWPWYKGVQVFNVNRKTLNGSYADNNPPTKFKCEIKEVDTSANKI